MTDPAQDALVEAVAKADRLAADAVFTDCPPFPLTAKLHAAVSQAFARHRATAEASARKAALDEAAGVAKSHKPDRKRPLSQFDPEDREIIRAEENGEAIAASVIATAIRALAEKDGR